MHAFFPFTPPHTPASSEAPAASGLFRHWCNNTWSVREHGGAHFVSYVDLAEAEGAEMAVGRLHRRLDRVAEHFFHVLADVGPHLFHRLARCKQRDNIFQKLIRIIIWFHFCITVFLWRMWTCCMTVRYDCHYINLIFWLLYTGT